MTIWISYDLLSPRHVDLATTLHQSLRARGIDVELLDVDRLGIEMGFFKSRRSTPDGAETLAGLYASAVKGSDGVISFEMADAMALIPGGGEVRIRDPRAGVVGQVTNMVTVYLGQGKVVAHKAITPGGFNAKDSEAKNLGSYESDSKLSSLVQDGLRWCGLV